MHQPGRGLASDVATTKEVAEALRALSPADTARLELIAKLRARYAPGLDWRDLLNEALAKALDGTRRWPRRLSFMLFLRETMRSEASEYVRRHVARPVVNASDLMGEGDEPSPVELAASEAPDPERCAIARDEVARIAALFADDPPALAVITGLALGLSPEEVQQGASLSPTQYASAQKRIRRGLARSNVSKDRNND